MKSTKIRIADGRSRRLRLAAAAAAAILALTACSGSGDTGGGTASPSGPVEEVDIKIGFVRSLVMTGVYSIPDYIAEGVNVEMFPFASGVDMATALNNGSIQFATPAWQQFLPGVAQGNDWVAVSGVARGGLQIVARDTVASGSQVDEETSTYIGDEDPWDLLVGKKIAVLPATFPYYALLAWLTRNGVDPDQDVELVNAPSFPDINTVMQTGGVDAAISLDPFPMQLRANGDAFLLSLPYSDDPDDYLTLSTTLITTGAYVEENSDTVAKVVAALDAASADLMDDHATWVDTVLEYAPFERSIVELSLNPEAVGGPPYDNNFLDTNMNEEGLRQWITLLHDLGALPEVVSEEELTEHLNYTFLEDATGKSAEELGSAG